jgi:DNA primase
MVTRFGLGAAPDSWSALTDKLISQGYGREELISAGVAKRGKSGGIYDAFRDRLVFPVIDVRGNVVAFSGRALGDGEPKYLNSSDTPVYSKSRNLFALNIAKKSKAGMLILVEGTIDVVALHQAGIDCAVASLGTALTQEQVNLLKQYTKSVVICYDSDSAGQKAAARAISLMENTDLSVRVLKIPDAKDPDEFIMKHGADAFSALLSKSENHVEYRLRAAALACDLDTEDGKIAYLKTAVAILAELDSSTEREVYGRRAAEKAGVGYESVAAEVSRTRKAKNKSQRRKLEQTQSRPKALIQPDDRALRYENEYSASAEQGVIRSLFSDPETFSAARRENLSAEEFSSPLLGRIYDMMRALDEQGAKITVTSISSRLEPNEASLLVRILEHPWSGADSHRAMGDYINKIRAERLKKNADINETLLALARSKQRKDWDNG